MQITLLNLKAVDCLDSLEKEVKQLIAQVLQDCKNNKNQNRAC